MREYAFDGPRGAWYRVEADDDPGYAWTNVRILDVLDGESAGAAEPEVAIDDGDDL